MVRRAISTIPTGARLFAGRCSVVPFQCALAILAMWSGSISFFNFTVASVAFNATLPQGFVVTFNLMYVLSGAFMIAGAGWGYRNVEAAGLVLFLTSMVVRLIALGSGFGFTPETGAAVVQATMFGGASLVRLRALLKGKTLVLVEDIPVLTERQVRGDA